MAESTPETEDYSELIRYLVLFVIVLTGILLLVIFKPFASDKPTQTDLAFNNRRNPAAAGNQPAEQQQNQDSLNADALNTEQLEEQETDIEDIQLNQNPNQQNTNQPQPPQRQQPNMQQPKQLPQPKMIIDAEQEYQALIQTSEGDIKIKLYASDTPKTVNNFVYLAQNNFYQGTIFHRVIEDFMIQGGDPTGTGMGGPGYKFEDEDSSNQLIKGSLAMANSGPDTNGSQFFIVTADSTPWLDGKHTNFGQVIEGMDVVEKIEQVKTGAQDRPVEPVVIEGVEILEK